MVPHESESLDESHGEEQAHASRCAEDGLVIEQVFSTPEVHPFNEVEWTRRSARISGADGEVIFEQNDVTVPADWSQLATNVVASKYFYGENGSDDRENSVKQLIHRVTRTIADWAKGDGIFASDADAERFYHELTYLCVNQYGAFNSPVWFNVGLFHQNGVKGCEGNYHWDDETSVPARVAYGYEYPQSSACFIQSVDDTMEDIMRLAQAEAMLFKFGSGTGTDLSTLRSSREKLSGGGTPSGPLSFMRIFDQVAAVVRSGGKTRRAAKMQSLRCDHPDIREFIECKMIEEKKAWALIEQGYDGSFNGDAYASVMYQNANLSVRVTDEFMQAALDDAEWQTFAVTTGEPETKYKARELLHLIAEGTHVCGDPGIQYHSTVNKWNTCSVSGEICASNPCSEYMFLNDSACNLASLNLMKFRGDDGALDVDRIRAAARLFIIAQETLVDHSSYPLARICRNSHDYRPLGLGYANLGALIMSLGLPYDSDGGRAMAACVTAILTGASYATSAELASRIGTFPQHRRNRKSMANVMKMHRDAIDGISAEHCDEYLLSAAVASWDEAIAAGDKFGYRNAQVTVLAPTGTIGFLMDCDTTGVEPDIALVKYKQLAGGGMFKIVNRTVPQALQRLGCSTDQIAEIVEYIDENDMIEGAPNLDEKRLAVFDCAFKPARGSRCIGYMGHIRMMGAVQPFLSGAISKTVNMPKEATVDEIMNVYIKAWKLGIKAVAVYRDGSKRTQPLNVSHVADPQGDHVGAIISIEQLEAARLKPHRRRLPATRPSVTHKFNVAGHEGYLNVGLYEDGSPGELFITMAKEGSTVGGMMDAFATAISLNLQYGVPLESLVKKFSHQRFEPSGMTDNRDIPFAKSIVDYIFRWLGLEFLAEVSPSEPKPAQQPDHGTPAALSSAEPTESSAFEIVREGVPSEPGRAEVTPDREVKGSLGALSDGTYASTHTADKPAGGNGEPAKAVALATAQRAEAPGANRLARINEQYRHFQEDAPPCDVCGALTYRNGNCYKCSNCGNSLGCG